MPGHRVRPRWRDDVHAAIERAVAFLLCVHCERRLAFDNCFAYHGRRSSWVDSSGSGPGVRPKGRAWPRHILGETRAEPIRLCRKRPFATRRRGRRPASATVCLIPSLILCLAYVERVCQCRAPNSPCGLHGRMASVIASLFSRSRPPPPAGLHATTPHIAASNEGLIVGRPVRNAVLHLVRGMDLRLHPCSVAPAEGHEKSAPPAGSSCNNAANHGHAPGPTEPPGPEAPLLFSEIRDLIVWGAVHPASDGEYENVQRVRHVLRRR